VIIFNSAESFFKKTETGSNRPVSVRFGFLGQKLVRTGLGRFFRFGSVFFVWLGFFGLGSVRFGFFGFRLIKPKPNRTGRFFQNFNRFFFTIRFFQLFFLIFSVFWFFYSTLGFIITVKGGLLLYKVKSLLTCSGPKLKMLFISLFCSHNQARPS
jgi:hypothetical protein